MPAEGPQWQYRVVAIDDDIAKVNATMAEWAEAGWELVSGAASSWFSKDLDSPMKVWHTQYITYWRKPVRLRTSPIL